MLLTQLQPSMPSTLVTGHYTAGYLPLTQLRDLGCRWAWNRRLPRAENNRGSGPQRGPTGPTAEGSLLASASDMPTVNGNKTLPSSGGNKQSNGVLTVSSNAPPYPTPQSTGCDHSRQNSRPHRFYDYYYSAREHRSPPLKREPETSRVQLTQRRSSNDVNSIASHLQIPPSINSSKGSLPEFAAQVRSRSEISC